MTYCYTTRSGVTVDKSFPIGKAPRFIRLGKCGLAYRDYQAEWSPAKNRVADPWPCRSRSMGVLPKQVPAMRKWLRDAGFNASDVDVTARGEIEFKNRRARKEVCKARGYKDLDAGYGDAT